MADGVACCGARRVKKQTSGSMSKSRSRLSGECLPHKNTWQYWDAWWEQEGRKTGKRKDETGMGKTEKIVKVEKLEKNIQSEYLKLVYNSLQVMSKSNAELLEKLYKC